MLSGMTPPEKLKNIPSDAGWPVLLLLVVIAAVIGAVVGVLTRSTGSLAPWLVGGTAFVSVLLATTVFMDITKRSQQIAIAVLSLLVLVAGAVVSYVP